MTRIISGFRAAPVLVAVAVVFHDSPQGAEASHYDVASPPAWVQPAPADTGWAAPPQEPAAAGTEYLLSDVQVRVDEGWSEYSHMVMRATNPSSVRDVSNLSLNFDPELDRLVMHSVTLRRSGESIDELQHGRTEVLQRESQLENDVLDGWQTFHLVMSDVRVGDEIDYSYTIEHHDPVWGNRFFRRYLTQWGAPVRRARVKILLRSHAPIFVRYPSQAQPVRADDGTWQTLEWNSEHLPAIAFEEEAPSWYVQYPRIELSQFATWKDLVDAALPLYSPQEAPSAELTSAGKKLSAAAHTDAERVLAVVRFVQEEIRYTGLELGSGAYRPATPAEVLRRRYGDCKDKTFLAVSLLRGMGIEAAPALVSTRWGRRLHERLPSPDDFDHAIVKIRLGSKNYWFDPTSTAQGGDLEEAVQADLGEALVIAPGTNALEEMPTAQPVGPLVAADVEFDLRAGLDKDASLNITTAYRGPRADELRRELRRKTATELGTEYLNYYKRRYSGVRAVGPPRVADNMHHNELVVTESYQIANTFEVGTNGRKSFVVEGEIINEHLRKIGTPVRTTPLALENPVDAIERIKLRMPEPFPVKDEVVKIDTASFHYDSRLSHSGNDILLEYRYRTLTDTVPRESVEEFLTKRAAAHDDTFLTLTTGRDEAPGETEAAQQLERAAQLAQSGQIEKTDDLLKDLLASDGFRGLTSLQQHAALYLAGAVALGKGDAERALDLLRRSSGMSEAATGDWSLRLLAASHTGDKADATQSLTTLAQRWPESLGDVDWRVIGRTVHDTPKAETSRYQLLSALFDANYTNEEFDVSNWWRDLALLQLQRNDRAAAQKALARVTAPYALISVQADNRFAPIRAGAGLDIQAAIEKQIQQAREAVKAHPTKLQPVVRLMLVLIESLRFADALQVADDAISAMNGPKGPKVYDDYRTYRIWVLDGRSQALFRLQKWDDAVAQLVSARELPESGNANVSQTINLAGEYNDLGKPREARATLAKLAPEGASPYGLMQAAVERLASADQLGDAAEAEQQLGFLRQHREDSLATYQRALISANRQDDAAHLLISRLQDPGERVDALMEVQEYEERPLPQRAAEWRRRWKAVRNRPEVREAINRVGNVSTYPLMPEPH
jgi:transglutaminase-like putative cysteine protease